MNNNLYNITKICCFMLKHWHSEKYYHNQCNIHFRSSGCRTLSEPLAGKAVFKWLKQCLKIKKSRVQSFFITNNPKRNFRSWATVIQHSPPRDIPLRLSIRNGKSARRLFCIRTCIGRFGRHLLHIILYRKHSGKRHI